VPTYEWNIEGAGPRWENPGELDASGPPWTSFGQMEVIHVSNAAGLPAESNPVEEFMESIGIRSFTAVPLISGRSVAGYLWLESIRKELHWDAEFLDLLKIAGQIFVHAMSRKHKAEDLAEAQEKARSRLTTLEQQNRESDLLRDLGDLLQVCRTMDEAYQIIPRFAQSLIPVGSGALYLTRDLDEPADKAAAWGEAPPLEPELLINECWALRRGRPHLVADPKSGLNCGHLKPPLPASYLCSPLTAQGETIGLLHLRWVGEAPGADVLAYYHDLAKKIAEHIALALSNLSLRDKLRSQAIRDPLTGLFNRRYMEETLDREIRRAARHGTPVGVIMFDVDHLKNINDAYGHDAGDVALQTLGNLLLKSFRGEDVPCRYGGDEFTIILPECSVSEVFRRAEQFREAFRKQEYEHEGKRFGPLTLSIGIAAYPDHGSTVERLMQVSDAASYAAKAQGRDRVMIGGAIEE
jgi:diguanylate cyclase (GGDEF)-like protein